MSGKQARRRKKYYSPAEANAALPLVRSIARDIAELARTLSERGQRLARYQKAEPGKIERAYEEEELHMLPEFERDQQRLKECIRELSNLGVELKDPHTGLVDFPCRTGDRDIYLCWRLGEPEVAFWHELDGGFAGRQKLPIKQNSQARSLASNTNED